jgi:hypothetical protein
MVKENRMVVTRDWRKWGFLCNRYTFSFSKGKIVTFVVINLLHNNVNIFYVNSIPKMIKMSNFLL